MIHSLIEMKRQEMYNSYLQNDTLEKTVWISQELDVLLNMDSVSRSTVSVETGTQVHNSAIKNLRHVIINYEPYYQSLIEKYGFLKDNHWYKLVDFYNVLEEIEKSNRNDTLEVIGFSVPNQCLFPNHLKTFEDNILNIDSAYKTNHSGGAAGRYVSHKIDSQNILLVCNTPTYPNKFNYGMIQGLASKFNEEISIKHTKTINGGEFLIKLER